MPVQCHGTCQKHETSPRLRFREYCLENGKLHVLVEVGRFSKAERLRDFQTN